MLLEAVARLNDGRVGERSVQLENQAVGSVVEAAVDADRPVDAMHHAYVVARETAQPTCVEVERVEEARLRRARDAVRFESQTAACQLARQRTDELVASSGRRRHVLVEDREIRSVASRRHPVDVGACRTKESPRVHHRSAGFRAEGHQPAANASRHTSSNRSAYRAVVASRRTLDPRRFSERGRTRPVVEQQVHRVRELDRDPPAARA